MTRIAINGINLNVEVSGRGPAVVALHGFTGSSATWESFARDASRDYTVVRVDLHGHGLSDAPPDPERYRMERCIEDLSAILDHLGLRRVHWLGYSLGGRIALSAAIALPHRTATLIAESASPGLATAEERAERVRSDEALADWVQEVGVQRFLEYWEALPLFASQRRLPSGTKEEIRAVRLGSTPIGLANSLRGIGTGAQPPMHERLLNLTAPVLFIAGEEDTKFASIAQAMHKTVPHSRTLIIAGAGHAAHLEKPREFNEAVRSFLANYRVRRFSTENIDPAHMVRQAHHEWGK